MKKGKLGFLLFCAVVLCLVLTLCHEEPLPYISTTIGIEKFQMVPASPNSKDPIKMVTYDCKYNTLASVKTKGYTVEVKKRFNSQMKWPCLLRLDTIPIGQLNLGYYKVTLLIIDTNPSVKDSVSVQESIYLRVIK
jgi:hypothetical protein